MLRGTVDAADADLAAARRALEDFSLLREEVVDEDFDDDEDEDDDEDDAIEVGSSSSSSSSSYGGIIVSGSKTLGFERLFERGFRRRRPRQPRPRRRRRPRGAQTEGPVRRAGFDPRGRGPTRLAHRAQEVRTARWRCCSTRTRTRGIRTRRRRGFGDFGGVQDARGRRRPRARPTAPASRGSNPRRRDTRGVPRDRLNPTRTASAHARGARRAAPPRIGSFSLTNATSTRTGSRGGSGCTRRPGRARTGRGTCPRRGARTRASVATRASTARGGVDPPRRGRREAGSRGRADGGDGRRRARETRRARGSW